MIHFRKSTSQRSYGYEWRHWLRPRIIFPIWGFFTIRRNLFIRHTQISVSRGGQHVWSMFRSPTLLLPSTGHQNRKLQLSRPAHYQPSFRGRWHESTKAQRGNTWITQKYTCKKYNKLRKVDVYRTWAVRLLMFPHDELVLFLSRVNKPIHGGSTRDCGKTKERYRRISQSRLTLFLGNNWFCINQTKLFEAIRANQSWTLDLQDVIGQDKWWVSNQISLFFWVRRIFFDNLFSASLSSTKMPTLSHSGKWLLESDKWRTNWELMSLVSRFLFWSVYCALTHHPRRSMNN